MVVSLSFPEEPQPDSAMTPKAARTAIPRAVTYRSWQCRPASRTYSWSRRSERSRAASTPLEIGGLSAAVRSALERRPRSYNPEFLDLSRWLYEHTFDACRMRPDPPLPADRRGRGAEDPEEAGGAVPGAGRCAADRGGLRTRGEVRVAAGDEDGRGALPLPRAGPDPTGS